MGGSATAEQGRKAGQVVTAVPTGLDYTGKLETHFRRRIPDGATEASEAKTSAV